MPEVKGLGKTNVIKKNCIVCQKPISYGALKCQACWYKERQRAGNLLIKGQEIKEGDKACIHFMVIDNQNKGICKYCGYEKQYPTFDELTLAKIGTIPGLSVKKEHICE